MDQKICQSCGMPLATAADFGTNKDNTPNEEYCAYCFKEGSFTQDVTMDQMIENCAQFLEEYNKDAVQKITKEEAVAQMKLYFPTLKRWAKA